MLSSTGDRGFESLSLQRGVKCEPRSRRNVSGSAMGIAGVVERPKKLFSVGSKCGVRLSTLTTSWSALPESHNPMSRMTIAPSALSALVTISGSTACMLTISSWVFSSSIPTSSLAHGRNHRRDQDRIEPATGWPDDCHMPARRPPRSRQRAEPVSASARARPSARWQSAACVALYS